MTCRHTIRQVAAFRVLLLCALGMVFSVLFTARYSIGLSEFWKLLPLVFAAFFLCAFLYLFVVRRVRKKWAHGAAVLLWVVVSGLPAAFFLNEWELFLAKLPAAVTAAVMLAAGVLCFVEGKKFIRQAMEDAYAVC
jgi:glucan phosphoethanolaminetransferase (alkaline phosphatase superfamily)